MNADKREALADALIAWADERYVDTFPGPDPHRGDTEYVCKFCGAVLKRSWEGDPTGQLDETKHRDNCLHLRARRLRGDATCPIHDFDLPCPSCAIVALEAGVGDDA